MKKSILITGEQGSGKTTHLLNLLSEYDKEKRIMMDFDEFKKSESHF